MAWIVPVLVVLPVGLTLFLRWWLGGAVKCPIRNRLNGKVVIITGASSGIGRATATECARRGGYVIMACRNEVKTRQVIVDIITETGCDANNLTYAHLDLCKLSSVEEFVESMAGERTVDILINNAGYLGPKKQTSESMDQSFVVNYLGHFLLTMRLLQMRQQRKDEQVSPMRIINLTSDSLKMTSLDMNDVTSQDITDIYQMYGRSKLAVLLFSRELARRYDARQVISVAVHPGAVQTGLQRHWPGMFGYALRFGAKIFFRAPEDGAQTTIFCASVTEEDFIKMNGQLYCDCSPMRIAHPQDNEDVAKWLWDSSLKLSRFQNGE